MVKKKKVGSEKKVVHEIRDFIYEKSFGVLTNFEIIALLEIVKFEIMLKMEGKRED